MSLFEDAIFCSVINHPKLSALTQPPFTISHGSGLVRAHLCVRSQLWVTLMTLLPLAGRLTWPCSLLVPGQPERVLVVSSGKPEGSRCGRALSQAPSAAHLYCPADRSKSCDHVQGQCESHRTCGVREAAGLGPLVQSGRMDLCFDLSPLLPFAHCVPLWAAPWSM